MKAYPAYKTSGVDWLDQVPSHWNRIAIKFLASEKNTLFLDGDWVESKDLSDDGIRYITTGNVGLGTYKEKGSGFISEQKFDELNCTEVFEGDMLISRLNSPIGRACLVPDLNNRIVTSVDNVIVRPNSQYSKRYLVYLFSSHEYINNTENLARGATMQRISRGMLGNIRIILPNSLEEQEKIADFLDIEVGRLDNLISEKENFIKLLHEKRKALISHIVTKGLNPNVDMKSSGVEWYGEIPEHWGKVKIKWVSNTESGGTPSTQQYDKYYENGEHPWIRTTDLNNSILLDTPIKITDEALTDSACSLIEKGAVLVAMYGGSGTIGKHALLGFTSTINQAVCAIKPTTKLYSEFLHLFVEFYRPFWMLFADGTRKDPNINQDVVRNMEFPLPPFVEQKEIVAEFKLQDERVRKLIIETEKSITLLKEHRTALISAAVTGKIDVREES